MKKTKKWVLMGTLAAALAFVVTGCGGDEGGDNKPTKVKLAGQVSKFVKADDGKIVLSPSSDGKLDYLVQDNSTGEFAWLNTTKWESGNLEFGDDSGDFGPVNEVSMKFRIHVLGSGDPNAIDVEVTGLVNGETYTVYVLDGKIDFTADSHAQDFNKTIPLTVNTAKVVTFLNEDGKNDVLTVAKSTTDEYGIAAVIPYKKDAPAEESYWKDYGKVSAALAPTTTGAIVVQTNTTADSTVTGCSAINLSGNYDASISLMDAVITIGANAEAEKYLVQRDADGMFAKLVSGTTYEFVPVTVTGSLATADVAPDFKIACNNNISGLAKSSYTVYESAGLVDFESKNKFNFNSGAIKVNKAKVVVFTNEGGGIDTLVVAVESGSIAGVIPLAALGETYEMGASPVQPMGGAIVVRSNVSIVASKK